MPKKIPKGYIIAGAALLVLAALGALVNFFTDLLWFNELGYASVFWKKLLTQLTYGAPLFAVITAVCVLYLRGIRKNYYNKIGVYDRTRKEKTINRVIWGLSLAFALFVAVAAARDLWYQILQYVNSSSFGISDPIFNQDVSFYIFKLEFYQLVNAMLMYVLVGFAIVNVVFYLAMLVLRRPVWMDEIDPDEQARYDREKAAYDEYQRTHSAGGNPNNPLGDMFGMFGGNMFGGQGQGSQGGPRPPRSARPSLLSVASLRRLVDIAELQLNVLGVLFFLLLGWRLYLRQYALLYTGTSGVVYGAGFTDINITLWVYRLLMVLAVAAAYMFVRAVKQRKPLRVFLVPALMIGISVLGGVASSAVQNLIVDPDEISKEYQYLENNIEFTRYAYDLQDIQIKDFNVQYGLDIDDIHNNTETISNIRINDYQPALKYYNQTQSIRLYYNFSDVDVDRYQVNGEYTQTFLSAREIDESAITDQWLTRHIKYTHGYGITLSRVDKVTDSGQPDMLIDSIPPVSDVEEIQIERPEIYFGEQTNNYVIVNTDEPEFDYPSGESNVYSEYEGEAGIRMTFLNRILFAMRERNLKLLVSTNIDSDSQILINRNVMDRITTIAPFLHYDADPYIVVADGKLYWIVDAYTVSSYYPYSEPYDTSGVNYIRNSVKVVVDAYNGDTNFYVVDADDPIAITLQKIYPALFKDIDELGDSLQAHLRYPNSMFSVQASVYTKYHMTDVNVFYQNEDAWDVATEVYGTEETVMTPNYYIMKLPGESQAEFINSVPYTPSGKFNMTALLVARNDGENYGDLVLYQLPKDRLTYGPQQVEAQINQHTEIAQDFTLWSSAGATYSRGNMFVIPIEDSLMYVEPIYLESANSSLPEVKRVVIFYNEKIAYEETLGEALESMFGAGAGDLLPGAAETEPSDESSGSLADATLDELAELANEAFANATQAQQQGDWSAYGRYLNQLGDLLEQMAPQQVEPLPETATPDAETADPAAEQAAPAQ